MAPGLKIYKESGIKLFETINKSDLSHIKLYIEDDDRKPVDFKGDSIGFTGQLIKL